MDSKISKSDQENKDLNKVSLNIKIEKDLDFRLKRARKVAREKKEIFNVSEIVNEFLNKKLLEFETENNIKDEIFNPNQITIFD